MKKFIFVAAFLLIASSAWAEKYILTLEVSQTHFTLNVFTHMADAANTAEFEIPVDKEYFDAVNVGDELNSDFRVGSAILKGSFGNWNVEVANKRIVK